MIDALMMMGGGDIRLTSTENLLGGWILMMGSFETI